VFASIDKILKKQNNQLSSYLSFEMPVTYVPVFKVYSQEKTNDVEQKMLKKLDVFSKIVINREKSQPKDPKYYAVFSHLLYPIITAWYQKRRFLSMEKLFYSESNCTGCGTCADVCLSQKIRLNKEKKPIWQDDVKCTYCFACLHFCPVQAIQIRGRNTKDKGRYHHPTIKAKDIALQKF
jgi:ferredoxin